VKSFEIDPGRTSVASAVNGFLGIDVRETIAFDEDRTIGLHHDDDRARPLILAAVNSSAACGTAVSAMAQDAIRTRTTDKVKRKRPAT
jgi:hypothetical protein